MPQIYKLDLTLGDFSQSGGWQSSDWGGADTPNADYPEFGAMENIQRREAYGASGQHVADAIDTNDYTVSWLALCGVGNLTGGKFDVRGGGAAQPLKCRWKQFFKSSALAEAGYSAPLVLANAGSSGSDPGLGAINTFLLIEMVQDTGANFWWNIRYRKPQFPGQSWSGFNFANSNNFGGAADGTSDDAEHELIVTMVPATVTSLFAGDGTLGTGAVDSDGSISLSVDGSVVESVSGVPWTVNHYGTSFPDVYYGRTIWHGD